MHKLFFDVPEGALEITVTGEDFTHLTVLRVKAGDTVEISDGVSRCYAATAVSFSRNGAVFSLAESNPFSCEPAVRMTVYCALLKSGKNDTVIQKAVELGAYSVVFFASRNCVAESDSEREDKKLARWNKISRQAAMQSGRDIVPVIRGVIPFGRMLDELSSEEAAFFLHEKAELSAYGLMKSMAAPKTFGYASGPEGGFTDDEAKEATNRGIRVVSLGKRILRAETVPLCVLSVCNALFE